MLTNKLLERANIEGNHDNEFTGTRGRQYPVSAVSPNIPFEQQCVLLQNE